VGHLEVAEEVLQALDRLASREGATEKHLAGTADRTRPGSPGIGSWNVTSA
jgi:hypothetical protein